MKKNEWVNENVRLVKIMIVDKRNNKLKEVKQ